MIQQTFSLNRLTIKTSSGDLKQAYEVLSSRALRNVMSSHVDQAPDDIIPHHLDSWFDDDSLRAAAHQISNEFGHGLVGLLEALQDTYWRGVKHIWPGGGLVSGKMGLLAIDIANAAQNIATFHLTPFPHHLGLIGMARYAPAGSKGGLIFDFGGTRIKCGRAIYHNDKLTRLDMLPSVSTRYLSAKRENVSPEEVKPLLVYMIDVIKERWDGEAFIGLSISTHMHDKQPISQGGYGNLQILSTSVFDVVREEVENALGQPVMFDWNHDGTAAASAYTQFSNSAAMTFGTAIGGAVAPDEELLWPISSAFKVAHHDSD